jgi:hypothetical protein
VFFSTAVGKLPQICTSFGLLATDRKVLARTQIRPIPNSAGL